MDEQRLRELTGRLAVRGRRRNLALGVLVGLVGILAVISIEAGPVSRTIAGWVMLVAALDVAGRICRHAWRSPLEAGREACVDELLRQREIAAQVRRWCFELLFALLLFPAGMFLAEQDSWSRMTPFCLVAVIWACAMAVISRNAERQLAGEIQRGRGLK